MLSNKLDVSDINSEILINSLSNYIKEKRCAYKDDNGERYTEFCSRKMIQDEFKKQGYSSNDIDNAITALEIDFNDQATNLARAMIEVGREYETYENSWVWDTSFIYNHFSDFGFTPEEIQYAINNSGIKTENLN
ncbi:MAG: hypothetical protein IK151_00840 [Erysipelotrichaceae bacterium]|nr:hypothetical protein [Erysipelotrichaceae bacterium]